MSTGEIRDGADILADIHQLTIQMMEQRHDSQFLIKGVEDRQMLIDEYELFGKADPEAKVILEKDAGTKRTLAKILDMDKVIFKSLQGLRDQSKQDLAKSNKQQKVLGYINNAISASGTYMDYKK